jgi:hypothetical protein
VRVWTRRQRSGLCFRRRLLSFLLPASAMGDVGQNSEQRRRGDVLTRIITGVMCLSCSWSLGAFARAEDSASLELEGELSCKFYRYTGALFREQTQRFTMRLAGANRWRMSNLEPSGRGSWERGCDGTNIFSVFLDPAFGRRPGLVGMVEGGVVPSTGYPGMLPWLALASSGFLQTNSAFPAPWADAYEPVAHIYDVRIRYAHLAPGIPEAIDWLVSTNKAKSLSENRWLAVSAQWPKDKLTNWTPDEPDGFLGATYRVSAFTNVAHCVLAVHFELTR